MSLDFQIISFELVSASSHYYQENTCRQQWRFYRRVLRVKISIIEIFSWHFLLAASKYVIKVFSCRFRNCLGRFDMFTMEGCSETRVTKHSSNYIFPSLYFRKYIGSECYLVFQNVQNLMKILKTERKIQKIFLLF